MIRLLLSLIIAPSMACAALTDFDRQELAAINGLAPFNSGFESGIAQLSYSSVAPVAVTSGSNLLTGKTSITWDSTAASQTLTGKAWTVPNGMKGKNCEVAIDSIMTPSGTATHTLAAWDGTNTLTSVSVTSSTTPVKASVNIPCPTSGTLTWRLTSVASNEPLIAIDDAWVGGARNIGSVSQATIYGTATYAATANCNWSVAGAVATPAADADCPTPTVTSYASAPATKIPAIRFAGGLPPGKYKITAIGQFVQARTAATSADMYLRFSDGTNSSAKSYNLSFGSTSSATQQYSQSTFVGLITYTAAQGDTTIALQTGGSGTGKIDTESSDFQLIVERLPLDSEQVFRPDVAPGSWSGYHQQDCSWALTSASYVDFTADASCTFTQQTNTNMGTVTTAGASLPGIIFTPAKAGRYLVTSTFSAHATSTIQTFAVRLTDGTTVYDEGECYSSGNTRCLITLTALVNATSTSAVTLKLQGLTPSGPLNVNTATAAKAASWKIIALDQSFPAPLLVGSVTSNSAGIQRHESVAVTTSCTSTPCTIATQSGSWVSSITRSATGTYAVNIVSGIFSASPRCFANSAGSARQIDVTTSSATLLVVAARNPTTLADSDSAFTIFCDGPK